MGELVRRAVLGGALGVLTLTVLGCRSSADARSGQGPGPSADPSPAPDGAPLLQVRVLLPPAPLEVTARSAVAQLTVLTGGTVITPIPERTLGTVPPELQQVDVDPAIVTDWGSRLVESGLLDDADFGQPEITDQPATVIDFSISGRSGSFGVYAFGEPGDGMVSAGQRDRRQRLRALLDEVRGWVADGVATPYPAQRAMILGERTEEPIADVAAWPGEDPAELETALGSTRGCGTVEGDPAETLLAAARDNPTALWARDGTVWKLVVVPMAPGQQGCRF